jgi:hypothetical protein
VNLQSPELNDLTSLVSSKLQGVDIGSITQSFKLPSLNNMSELLKNLTPQNLTQFAEDGARQLLSPSNLQDAIKSGIDSLKDEIEGEIKGVLDQVVNTANTVKSTAEQISSTIQNIGNLDILSQQSGFFEEAFNNLSNITNLNIDFGTVSKFGQTISKATGSLRELSPKQVRDLANPEYYNKVVKETLNTANTMLESDVLEAAKDFIKVPSNIGSVAGLFTTANTLLGSSGPSAKSEEYSLEVKISTYYGKGDGADVDAFNKKSATGKQLKSGKSCAVDNVKILFDSKVEVPGLGTFTAVDKLKGGGADLQLYYETAQEALKAQAKIPGKVLVKVKPPKVSVAISEAFTTTRGKEAKLI